ncbi:MAG TPA: MarR family transcriptional regulator, partial [Bacillaceae bacterium]
LKEYEPLMKYNLTTKQEMILMLIRKENKLTVSEIASKMNVTSSAASQIISKLEKENFIKRDINPNNRREIIVTLHQRGEEFFKEYKKIELHIIEHYYSKLELDEIVTLRNITLKLERLMAETIK